MENSKKVGRAAATAAVAQEVARIALEVAENTKLETTLRELDYAAATGGQVAATGHVGGFPRVMILAGVLWKIARRVGSTPPTSVETFATKAADLRA